MDMPPVVTDVNLSFFFVVQPSNRFPGKPAVIDRQHGFRVVRGEEKHEKRGCFAVRRISFSCVLFSVQQLVIPFSVVSQCVTSGGDTQVDIRVDVVRVCRTRYLFVRSRDRVARKLNSNTHHYVRMFLGIVL